MFFVICLVKTKTKAMSNIGIIVPERAASIGAFMVGRLLPFVEKRTVGPFVFIDHMGPLAFQADENIDIGPHPHIGLSTLTYLFEGAMMHRDSLGTTVEIKPGAVNWMTAGKGVTHSERRPPSLQGKDGQLHGLQIWVALPKDQQEIEPNFTHISAPDIPAWEENGVHYKLIAGEAFQKKSPVPVYSPLYFIEIASEKGASVQLGDHLYGESALYILEGAIEAEGHTYGPKQILIAKDTKLCAFTLHPGTSVYIFGGEAFPEPRHIHWNFVSTDKERINQAKEQWIAQQFPKIPGEENEFVPFPGT
jgi:redox-sensitive bicupin YhaK (pirin superfamily)